MELINLMEHLHKLTVLIDNFNPIEINVKKCGYEQNEWGCDISIRWDLHTVNQFAQLGYDFTHYEMGIIGEHKSNYCYGIHIFIK